ncbi:hypothetical protein CPB97_004549 [Podila verticillata]|nr:hypothetical protein CPB97_004549 [Podila verticillata]
MSTSESWSNLNQLPVNRFFKVEPNPRNWLPAMFFLYRNDRETHTFNFEHEYRHSLRLIAVSAMATQEQRSVAAWLHENVTKKHFLAVFAAFVPHESEITQGDATIGLLHEDPIIPLILH